MIRRLLAVWHARNLEFVRDRGSLIFSLLLPLGVVIGMGFVFGGPERPLFKAGVLVPHAQSAHLDTYLDNKSDPFLKETRYVQLVAEPSEKEALAKLTHQQIDILVDLASRRYWVNSDSPKGYIAEKLLLADDHDMQRAQVQGSAVRYVDWLLPGVLAMNMMFSCLFGVGYVVLRYRKTGFLKRLRATPLTAFEFLSAQVLSRLSLILTITTILYVGISTVIHFHSQGSTLLLALVAVLGALSMIALGLTVAAAISSEELVGGILNLLTWPMMLISGIWFSLEGAPRWIQWASHAFPLTHIIEAARAVMLDGAGIAQIAPNLLYLGATTLLFLGFGAWTFRWRAN
jgi:ABC-type multidrug transport system permease subunit